ncbi:MAG: flagellar hook-length control protein FliK, partial [Rhodocyclaceae bacterium]|nr:flagellar hook-length control protein FliK [Rhodocyclaceae bacterium]
RSQGKDFAAQLEARGERVGRPLDMVTPAGTTAATPGSATAVPSAALPLTAAERPAAAALPMHVSTPASSTAWADAVGNRVMWLVGREESRAELILTPPHLGKLEISLTVSGDTTTAQFMAATPAAREALENAMPRLREMLEQAGVTLAESNVNTAAQDQAGAQHENGSPRGGHSTPRDVTAASGAPLPAGPWLQSGRGLIDTFA